MNRGLGARYRRRGSVTHRAARREGSRSVLVAFLLLLGLLLPSCDTNPATGKKELVLLSEKQELKIGRQLYPSVLWNAEGGGGPYNDAALKSYLGRIVDKLHSVSHISKQPLVFEVQNSPVPNAWAVPGHVVITRGLLTELGSEAQFAFVMGHEIGHLSARHSSTQLTYRLIKQMGLGIARIAFGDEEYLDAALVAGSLGGDLLLLRHSRSDELQADRLGVTYMVKLGYDPKEAVEAQRSLHAASQKYLRSLGKGARERMFFEELLSTHPDTSERVKEIKDATASLDGIKVSRDSNNESAYKQMILRIRAAEPALKPREGA